MQQPRKSPLRQPLSILVALFGTEGDMRPLIWFAQGMAARGHRITAHVNPRYRALADAHGWRVIELGTIDDFNNVLDDPRIWVPVEGTQLVFDAMLRAYPMYRESLDAANERFDLAVGTVLASGALAWAQSKGAARLMAALQPLGLRSAYDCPLYAPSLAWLVHMPPWLLRALFRMSDAFGAREILRPLNEHRRALALPPLRTFEHLVRDADAIAALFPAWLAAVQPDWPPQLTQLGFPWPPGESPPLDATVERFLERGEAPIVWTHGSANVDVERFMTGARAATRALRMRGIFVGPGSDTSDDFIAIAHAPFERLLPRCRAIVHHAGIGTAMHAFAAGIPQLLVPRAHDQFDNAWRVARTGVGTRMHYRSFSGDRAARALRTMLGSEDVRVACLRTRELMRDNDPLAALCDLAEAVAKRSALQLDLGA